MLTREKIEEHRIAILSTDIEQTRDRLNETRANLESYLENTSSRTKRIALFITFVIVTVLTSICAFVFPIISKTNNDDSIKNKFDIAGYALFGASILSAIILRRFIQSPNDKPVSTLSNAHKGTYNTLLARFTSMNQSLNALYRDDINKPGELPLLNHFTNSTSEKLNDNEITLKNARVEINSIDAIANATERLLAKKRGAPAINDNASPPPVEISTKSVEDIRTPLISGSR